MNELYGWKPPASTAKNYLRQRDAEQVAAERAVLTDRYKRSVTWLEKYHTRGRKTAINWSPSITVTKPEETTSEAEIHHQESHTAKVGIAEGVGDAAGEQGNVNGGANPVRRSGGGRDGDSQSDSQRFARQGHTDFGDGDTPF